MPKIEYEAWNPDPDSLRDALRAQALVENYEAQGFKLSLRQVYYQFVSRDWIPNSERSYKRLGNIVSRGRRAGLIDWDGIEDRNRELEYRQRWRNPQEIIKASARSYHIDLWEGQPFRVEVWVEKAALGGIVKTAAEGLDCPWFACRGYPSDSEIWAAGQRFGEHLADGQRVIVVHLGDHDPSGIDMTRDLTDRLKMFAYHDLADGLDLWGSDIDSDEVEEAVEGAYFGDWEGPDVLDGGDYGDLITVRRVALNMDQVRLYNPPPNPAKLTDARAKGYVAKYGRSSWELDALSPEVLNALIQTTIREYIEPEAWAERVARSAKEKELLTTNSQRWSEVVALLEREEE